MPSRREILGMPEQKLELELNPALKRAVEKSRIEDLKNDIIEIISTKNINRIDIENINNVTSIKVLEILLSYLQNETNI